MNGCCKAICAIFFRQTPATAPAREIAIGYTAKDAFLTRTYSIVGEPKFAKSTEDLAQRISNICLSDEGGSRINNFLRKSNSIAHEIFYKNEHNWDCHLAGYIQTSNVGLRSGFMALLDQCEKEGLHLDRGLTI